jgi:protocatechuate 3,4-dioxygenase beta subunit
MEIKELTLNLLLSRREALKVLGAAIAAILTGWAPIFSGSRLSDSASAQTRSPSNPGALSSCIVRPEVTEGPYYVREDLNRSDVRSDPNTGAVKDGALLNLTFRVSQLSNGSCSPLAGARVEIWHCDASGLYSDVRDPGFNTVGQKFLRGYQMTDANGQARFITVYPGWYSGRAVHIHFKVHHDTSPQSSVFTSQLFFDDSLSDQVHSNVPYASRGRRDTLNSTDRIYREELLPTVTQAGGGYAATFDIALN